MAETGLLTRRRAGRILIEGRTRTLHLIERLPRAAASTGGLDGGAWSPKDLLGHLASWEEYAVDALAAWSLERRAPIDDLWRTLSTSRINQQNVDAKSAWTLTKVRRESERTRRELLAAIQAMSDARWRRPATERGRKPLGARLGAILGGPGGPFRHEEAHLPSLEAFVRQRLGD